MPTKYDAVQMGEEQAAEMVKILEASERERGQADQGDENTKDNQIRTLVKNNERLEEELKKRDSQILLLQRQLQKDEKAKIVSICLPPTGPAEFEMEGDWVNRDWMTLQRPFMQAVRENQMKKERALQKKEGKK